MREEVGRAKESRERGATIVLVAIAMTALLSVVALAIDVGMLLNSRSEAQRAADAGAMAGAQSLLPEPNDANRAEGFILFSTVTAPLEVLIQPTCESATIVARFTRKTEND